MEKLSKIMLVIYFFVISSNCLKCEEFAYVGDDSIRIVNYMMKYHLDFIKNSIEYENITFHKPENRTYTLRELYDSLKSIYLPFNTNTTVRSIWYEGGLNSMNWFLVDSNTIYTLWIFIPDSLFLNSGLLQKMETTSKIRINEILKFEDFGVLAYKDKKISFIKNDELLGKEYLNLLKLLDKKKP
ncbi:MAG: hypothetical protein KIT33_01410 [Candidatus Kapabacteria bacterium]|nr:hypothetical protein [Ignavibacteriota bacterium]MCW5883607.1 hypothetical protein [Candidatus Kapabacteria bacterium]